MKSSPDAVVPAARTERLVVEHLRDETLIYDLERDEAHHLNPTAAAVFDLCDGRRTVAALSVRVAERLGQPVTTETVRDALEQLAACKLLVGAPEVDVGVSRRELVRKAALVGAGAAAAAPVIKSIVAPTPALAQSPEPGCAGQPCTGIAQCPGNEIDDPAGCTTGRCRCRRPGNLANCNGATDCTCQCA